MSRLVLAAAVLGVSALPAVAGGCVGQCYRQTYVPPTYETVTEKVVVQAPRTYAVTTPAQYRTYSETVQVSPGGRHWTVKHDSWGNKVGCWVTTPPRFATVPRTVMVAPPQVVPYAVPAQYGYRTHTVQASAGYKTWSPVGHGGGYGPSYGQGYRSGGYGSSYGHGYGSSHGYGQGYGYGRPSGGLFGAIAGAGFGVAGAGLSTAGSVAGSVLDF